MSEHTDDIRNIDEGDEVVLTIDDRVTIEVTCTDYTCKNARDPEIIRERHKWYFDDDGDALIAGVTDGLRERPEMEPFPRHNQLFNQTDKETLGYITEVEFQ
jgi:hypothetical protein